MTAPPNQDKPKIGRASWEFTYTGQVLAEVAKKRIGEIEVRKEECRKGIVELGYPKMDESSTIKDRRRGLMDSQLEYWRQIGDIEKWVFAFEKHPENKFDLDRDDFIYFFQERK